MRIPTKILFVFLSLMLSLGYVGCFVLGMSDLPNSGCMYVFLWCSAIAPTISAVVFSRIGQPICGGLITVPFGAGLIYYRCVLPQINTEIVSPSVGILLFMLCIDTACALLPAGLVHCVCHRLGKAAEAKLITRLRIGALKAMQVMSVGVLCGIPVVFLLAPTPLKPAALIPWECIISVVLLATIPLAGALGIATALVCPLGSVALAE